MGCKSILVRKGSIVAKTAVTYDSKSHIVTDLTLSK